MIALQIMRANYEQLVKAHQAQPLDKEKAFVPNEIKFQTFQLFMDKLFNSFNEQVIHFLIIENFASLLQIFCWVFLLVLKNFVFWEV